MMQMIQLPESAVFLKDGHAVTTSLKVAEVFGKQHKDVMRVVRNFDGSEGFTEPNFGPTSEFWRRNFAPSTYRDERGKTQPMYELTKNGFAFLAMGFTGPEATRFKIAYINRFDEMEAALMQAYIQPAAQVENYWFPRRAHWPQVRTLALAGKSYREIGEIMDIKRGRVSRAIKRMIEVGLLSPFKIAEVQKGPARKAAIGYCARWGRPAENKQMAFDFEVLQ